MENRYQLQDHNGNRIGKMYCYFDLKVARAVAARTIGKWKKNNDLRGKGIKLVQLDNSGSIYSQDKTLEWFHSA